jgi:NADP-dependent 3-hydroxy acid dehydrogenase YdfG
MPRGDALETLASILKGDRHMPSVAVATGAAGGIGYACAKLFAEKGMAVVLGDIDKAKLAKAVAELKSAGHTVEGHGSAPKKRKG